MLFQQSDKFPPKHQLPMVLWLLFCFTPTFHLFSTLGHFGEWGLLNLDGFSSLTTARLKITQFRLKTGLTGPSPRLASRNSDGIMAAFEFRLWLINNQDRSAKKTDNEYENKFGRANLVSIPLSGSDASALSL